MWYMSVKPEKLGPKIAAKVGKEVGIAAPAHTTLTEPTPEPFANDIAWGKTKVVKGGLAGLATRLVDTFGKPVVFVQFHFEQPRPFDMIVSVILVDGGGIFVGSVLYSTHLSKSVASEISLEAQKGRSKWRFVGDAAMAEKLNGNSSLVMATSDLVREKYVPVAKVKVTATSMLRIAPGPGGSSLVLKTLPVTKWFGYVSSFNVKAFLGFADLLEKAL